MPPVVKETAIGMGEDGVPHEESDNDDHDVNVNVSAQQWRVGSCASLMRAEHCPWSGHGFGQAQLIHVPKDHVCSWPVEWNTVQ
jgi:hypothetical protein